MVERNRGVLTVGLGLKLWVWDLLAVGLLQWVWVLLVVGWFFYFILFYFFLVVGFAQSCSSVVVVSAMGCGRGLCS